jgi:hypothetical protein
LSKLALVTSAQRPSTPLQQRTIELIERLIASALAASWTAKVPAQDSPSRICLNGPANSGREDNAMTLRSRLHSEPITSAAFCARAISSRRARKRREAR